MTSCMITTITGIRKLKNQRKPQASTFLQTEVFTALGRLFILKALFLLKTQLKKPAV